MDIEIKQTITQIIAFLAMLWILKRFAWKPFLAILDERTEKIKSIFDEAENKLQEADALKADYDKKIANIEAEGQGIIQDAANQARQVAEEIEQQAQNKAHEIIDKAHTQLHTDIEKSKEGLKKEMIDVAFYAMEKLAYKKISKEDRDHFAKEVMNEVR